MHDFCDIPPVSLDVDNYVQKNSLSISSDLIASSSIALFFTSCTRLSLIPLSTASPSSPSSKERCRNCSSGLGIALFFAVRQRRTQKQCDTSKQSLTSKCQEYCAALTGVSIPLVGGILPEAHEPPARRRVADSARALRPGNNHLEGVM